MYIYRPGFAHKIIRLLANEMHFSESVATSFAGSFFFLASLSPQEARREESLGTRLQPSLCEEPATQ